MDRPESPRLQSIFRVIVAGRWWLVGVYALLFPLAIGLALRVESDNSIARLVVESDPDYRDTAAFQALFPEGEHVVLLAEAPDPFAPETLAKVAELESRLARVRRVEPFSALTIYRRTHPGAVLSGSAATAADLRRFVTGTELFRRQGLAGPDFLGITLALNVDGAAERDETLAAIDRVVAPFAAAPAPLVAIRKVGGPYVDAYLEAETASASLKYFPLFGLFVIAINLTLYRSARTLAAFLITLAVSVALTVGFGKVAGFAFTIVSSLVPLTILVTCTAALVYIQSRFAEHPGDTSVDEHQIFTLANKFLATTASIVAAAIGFAALAVSRIRPIRDMGLWTASGLLLTWVVVFTLFPALQRILRTPVLRRRTAAGRTVLRLIDLLPGFSYRWRWVILPLSFVLMAGGVLALTGVPGRIAPMSLETDALDYIDRDLPIYRDTRRFESALGGLSVVQVWITTPAGGALDPELLRGLERFARLLEEDGRVGSVVGPTTMLRFVSYVGGQGDRLPDDPVAWPALAAQLDQMLLQEKALRGFVDVGSLADARLTVIYRGKEFDRVEALKAFIRGTWERAAADVPALAAARMRVVGQGLLQMKIAQYLVPTLTESFALTAVVIFVAFLVVFRSPAARLMAIIPSLFAILVMFLFMRLTGIPLNVATILIASTVLGASENDQIHFFYHFQERRNGATTEQALRHALLIAGRAILFAIGERLRPVDAGQLHRPAGGAVGLLPRVPGRDEAARGSRRVLTALIGVQPDGRIGSAAGGPPAGIDVRVPVAQVPLRGLTLCVRGVALLVRARGRRRHGAADDEVRQRRLIRAVNGLKPGEQRPDGRGYCSDDGSCKKGPRDMSHQTASCVGRSVTPDTGPKPLRAAPATPPARRDGTPGLPIRPYSGRAGGAAGSAFMRG